MVTQVRVPDAVDDKAASQFLVNPVTGGKPHCVPPDPENMLGIAAAELQAHFLAAKLGPHAPAAYGLVEDLGVPKGKWLLQVPQLPGLLHEGVLGQ